MIPVKNSLAIFSVIFLISIVVIQAEAGTPTFHLTVKSNPNIVFISGSGDYTEGELVTIDSAPNQFRDYTFSHWEIDGRWSDENPLVIRMDRNHVVEAIYDKTGIVGGIVVDIIPRISDITIDGTIYLASELPLSFSWETGSEHIVDIPMTVTSGPDTRYMFDSWKDQNTETFRTIIAEEDGEYIALYKTQHYLKPITEVGNVLGGGWVDEGTLANFEIESDIVYDRKNENIRYVFNSWNKGDYPNSESNVIAIQNAETVKTNWDTQYHLQVQTNIPEYNLFGTGWYEKNKQIALIAETELDSPKSDIKYVFDRWVSKGPNPVIVPNSHSPSTTITVQDPYVIEAHYKKSYRVNVWTPFGSATGSGFYDEGTSAQISIVNAEVPVDPNRERMVFTGWDTDGARTMGSLNEKASAPTKGSLAELKGETQGAGNQNLLVFVDGPTNVTAKWKPQYYLDLRSTDGQPQGGGWYDVGKMAQISLKSGTTPPGMWSTNTFSGWTGDVESKSLKERVVMNEPKTVIAEWQQDNTPGIVNSIILGGIAIVGAIIYKKTHKSQTFGSKNQLNDKNQKPFDMYFNTKTRDSSSKQNEQGFNSKQKKLDSIISWLMGRK